MKKLLTSLLVLVMLLTVALGTFVACGGPATQNPGETPDDVDYEKTIIFYSSQGDKLQALTANAIASFEAKYPGWTVKHSTQGGYDDVKEKIIQDFQGGYQPDLAYCYPDHVAQYIQTEKVVNLNKYLKSTETITVNGEEVLVGYTAEELADFVPGYYNEGLATNYAGYEEYGYEDEDMLTLPFVKSTELLYYNATALKALELVDEQGNAKPAETWDELWEHCAKAKAKWSTCTPLGYDSEANWFITACEQNGWGYTSTDAKNHYLFNNDNTKAWLQTLRDYYQLGYITTEEDYKAYTSTLFTKGVDDGGLLYCIGSSGGASYQATDKFEWGVAPTPGSVQGDGSISRKAISQGPSLVMLTGGNGVKNASEKEKMTFLFIKELLDPMFQASFGITSGYNPCRISVAGDGTEAKPGIEQYLEHLAKEDNITAVAAKVAASMNDRYFVSPAFVGSSMARTQVGNALLFVIQGTKTPAEALADAYNNCGGK